MPASSQFLTLGTAEVELIDCKLAVVLAIKEEQRKRKLTTDKLATRIGLSPARAKALLECDADVALDEIAIAYFRLDMNRSDFGSAVQRDVASAWGVEAPARRSRKLTVVRRSRASTSAPRETTRRAA